MKPATRRRVLFSISAIISLCLVLFLSYNDGRAIQPASTEEELFEGVTYHRIVRNQPRPMVAHVLVIDTRTPGLKFLVTPPDAKGEYPLVARRTSEFLAEFNVQIAINGDGFIPWWSRSPFDYYPHTGDPVTPIGKTASRGRVYALDSEKVVGVEPTLYIGRRNRLVFNLEPNNVYNAISGDRMLVLNGQPLGGLGDKDLDPRTAIGFDQKRRHVIIVVVDGRQPFYSMGATFVELADILVEYGAFEGMNLDGGGSSTLVIEGEDGKPVILNSPIDNYIPGRERSVANHLGIVIP